MKLDDKKAEEIVGMLLSKSVMLDALIKLLTEKGIVTQDEYIEAMNEIQADYEDKFELFYSDD